MATKTLIRSNAFETNSSSTHSITIGKTGTYCGITPDWDNVVRFVPGEYGWGPEDFTSVDDRLSYLWIYIKDWVSDPAKQAEFMNMFKICVIEHTGASDVEPILRNDYSPYGYIDHQSVESNDLDYIFESGETLKSFLFDKNTCIHTNNDNY